MINWKLHKNSSIIILQKDKTLICNLKKYKKKAETLNGDSYCSSYPDKYDYMSLQKHIWGLFWESWSECAL